VAARQAAADGETPGMWHGCVAAGAD